MISARHLERRGKERGDVITNLGAKIRFARICDEHESRIVSEDAPKFHLFIRLVLSSAAPRRWKRGRETTWHEISMRETL